MTTNLAASVRARLLNLAKGRGVAFQEILVRYGIERLLYRLQNSEYGREFVLKGATLFLNWTDQMHRPTKDVDFLSFGSPEIERLVTVFSHVVETVVEADGLEFVGDSIVGSEIREGEIYQGVRIKMEAKLGSARIPLQLDIGFGDAVVPPPRLVRIPPLLAFPAAELTGYTRYTAVAEKYDAMIKLGEFNSRFKDFFDIWTLSRTFEFEGALLRESIQATCSRRETQLPAEKPIALTSAFAALNGKEVQWRSFVKKSRLGSEVPGFVQVIDDIAALLWPVTQAITNGEDFNKRWSNGGWL